MHQQNVMYIKVKKVRSEVPVRKQDGANIPIGYPLGGMDSPLYNTQAKEKIGFTPFEVQVGEVVNTKTSPPLIPEESVLTTPSIM